MSQQYVEIPSSKKISESLADILGNDKTALSCNEGAAFPSANLFQGMLCLRSDENKLYQLKSLIKNEQVCIADLNGSFRHLEGGQGNAISWSKRDLNDYTNMPTGIYCGNNMLNAPDSGMQRVVMIRDEKITNSENAQQMAFSQVNGSIMTRQEIGGVWSSQRQVVTSQPSATGSTAQGLSADQLDGYDAGNNANQIPISNGVLNKNLNAQYLNGKELGNSANNVPVSNGTLCTNLNAQKLSGMTAGNGPNQIPVSNNNICSGLNAQMVGGISAERLLKVDANSNVTQAVNTFQINNARIMNSDNTRYYNGTQYGQSCLYGSNVEGSFATNNSGTHIPFKDGQSSQRACIERTYYKMHTGGGIGAGNYTLFQLLQELVYRSHTHSFEKLTTHEQCDCRCRCDCNCDCNDGD